MPCAPWWKKASSIPRRRWCVPRFARTSRNTRDGDEMAQIDALFREMTALGGSDLHLEQGRKPKVRVNGDLMDLPSPAMSGERLRELLGEISGEERWQKFETAGDLDFAYA